MQIKVWGFLTISKNQFIIIESLFILFFLLLTIFFFSYRFPEHISDPEILFHAKYLKYVSLVFTFLMIIQTQFYLSKFIQKQLDINRLQKEKIEAQKESITSSIRYASRIQTALLPPENEIPENMEHFIFFRPKDIVSGDYYWISRKGNKTVFVAADCTGHGVPGAFMSALGIAFLNEIVNLNAEKCHAHEILNQLKQKIGEAFYRHESKTLTQDGMDMALCIFDGDSYELEYAGAFNPMFLVRSKKNTSVGLPQKDKKTDRTETDEYCLVHFKPNRMPIGISPHTEKFDSQTVKLKKGDTVYIFSDGYTEQLGGKKGRRYFTKRFKQFLLSIQNYPMDKQKRLLAENFESWRLTPGAEQFEQLDDLLVIGLRLKD